MKTVLIEDEAMIARRLERLLMEVDPTLEIAGVLGSVAEVRRFFADGSRDIDLIISDIRLGDGTVFDALDGLGLKVHIVFVTAYDEYAVKAFKFNGIDYILKPPTRDDLRHALKRARELQRIPLLETLSGLRKANPAQYRRRIVCESCGGAFGKIDVEEIAYFHVDAGRVKLHTFEGREYVIPERLDQLEEELDPARFFRANRQYIIHIDSIEKAVNLWNRKLDVHLRPELGVTDRILVSRENLTRFKRWLNS